MERTAIVTGTSRGIGTATASALLERGWHVTGIARGKAPAELEHERYVHARVDLGDLTATEVFFEDWAGRDINWSDRVALVNNAAVLGPVGLTPDLAATELRHAYAVNVIAPVWLMGFVLRHARGPLRIINLSSGAATGAYPGWSSYCGGKAALRMTGMVLGVELAEAEVTRSKDVAVVAYAPHVVATAMQEEIRETDEAGFPRRARFHELHEQGHLVPPSGPAAEIADLCEAESLPPFSEARFEP